MQNKFLILLIVILFVGFSFGSYKIGKENTEKRINMQESQKGESVLGNVQENNQDEIEEIISAGDIAKCDQVKTVDEQNFCKSEIASRQAVESGDLGYCEKLKGQGVDPAGCESALASEKMKKTESVEACNLISNNKTRKNCEFSFYNSQSKTKKDISICDKIDDSVYAMFCRNEYKEMVK